MDHRENQFIKQEERLALKDRSLTTDQERSWFEPTISGALLNKMISS